MTDPTGESAGGALRLGYNRRLMLRFRGAAIPSDAGLLAYRELDDALRLTTAAGAALADARTGKNGRHARVSLLGRSVFERLPGRQSSTLLLSNGLPQRPKRAHPALCRSGHPGNVRWKGIVRLSMHNTSHRPVPSRSTQEISK